MSARSYTNSPVTNYSTFVKILGLLCIAINVLQKGRYNIQKEIEEDELNNEIPYECLYFKSLAEVNVSVLMYEYIILHLSVLSIPS